MGVDAPTPFALSIGIDNVRYPHIHIDASTELYALTNTATVIGKGARPISRDRRARDRDRDALAFFFFKPPGEEKRESKKKTPHFFLSLVFSLLLSLSLFFFPSFKKKERERERVQTEKFCLHFRALNRTHKH